MKPRQRSVCNNCRRRKLGCDGKRPECTQCVFVRQKCDGYPSPWKFVSQRPGPGDLSTGKKSVRMENSVEQSSDLRPCQGAVLHNSHASLNDIVVGAAKPPRNTLSSDLPQANWPIHDQYINTIVKAFTPDDHGSFISPKSSGREPQICGSWVEVLPHLSVGCDPHGALPKAIKALSASIVQPGPHQASERLDLIQAYHSAIKSLRRALPIPGYQNRAESAATMMCLCLAELMLPGSSTGPEMHARGISALFETHGPSAVRQGFLHKLYAGFLPLVVLEAFRDRKPTFVASEEWQNVPFSVTG